MGAAQTELLIRKLAADFWNRAAKHEPYPRNLEWPVLRGLPVGIIKLPQLGLAKARTWMRERGVASELNGRDRPLRGLLVARAGEGLIFLDGADSADDQRLALAHEVAHFLKDHLHPRERALETFGDGILGVLDGTRSPTYEEQLTGTIAGVRLGVFSHLLDRNESGFAFHAKVIQAEDIADRLALELLAPEPEVAAQVEATGATWRSLESEALTENVLVSQFGLPPAIATRYGAYIVMRRRAPKSFRGWLYGP